MLLIILDSLSLNANRSDERAMLAVQISSLAGNVSSSKWRNFLLFNHCGLIDFFVFFFF